MYFVLEKKSRNSNAWYSCEGILHLKALKHLQKSSLQKNPLIPTTKYLTDC